MRVDSVEVVGLYGSISRKVEVNEHLSLLVGINGSGKTSLLNCIDWLLRPDLVSLSLTEFKRIKLNLRMGKDRYSLVAEKTKSSLTIRREGGKKLEPIKVQLLHKMSKAFSSSSRRQMYEGLQPEDHERELWSFMETLPAPLTIQLDRSITTELSEEVFLDSGVSGKLKRERKIRSPMEKVADVTRDAFAGYREKLISLNASLKDKVVISAFRDPFEFKKIDSKKKISLTEIARLEKRMASLLESSIGTDESQGMISKYFERAKQIAQASETDANFRSLFWAQFRQLGDLAANFDDFEQQSSAAYEKIRSFLEAVNYFFADSNKAIGFNEHNGSLAFKYLGGIAGDSSDYQSITGLSSGERQILIMLTLLAFVAEPGRMFVVDEPELSLHPKWQRAFLDAVLSQAPAGTQIIMATHSPEIVASYSDSCIVLEP